MAQAPSSPILQQNREAALLQTKMNIRILAMKHAMKLESCRTALENTRLAVADEGCEPKMPNAVELVAQASIIEDYLNQGILTPATMGADAEKTSH